MLTRRHFLGTLAGLTASLTLPRGAAAQEDRVGRPLPLRKLGRSDEEVTMLGLGGAHVSDLPEDKAQGQIEVAIENGVRFFDTAEAYGRGRSETYYGRHLVPKHRDIGFIMTKSRALDAETAKRHLDESRQRLGVDVLDLWQVHDITSAEDVDKRFDAGVIDVFLEAKAGGKARYIGFTGHTSPKAHLRMLERLKGMGVEMDATQMPINVVDPHYESFIENVVPPAVERGYAVLAMKTLSYGQILGRQVGWRNRGGAAAVVPEAMTVEQALGFVWSLPVTTLIIGCHEPGELKEDCEMARRFVQLDEAGRRALVEATAKYDAKGIEFYKA